MAFGFRSRFKARHDGGLEFRIADEERGLISELLDQLRELLMGTAATGAVDPALRRLYPTAYPDDANRDTDYQNLMRDELLERRLAALDSVESTLQADQLDAEEAMAWLTTLNDVRLILGTSLDVSEDDDLTELDPTDPEQRPRAIYHYLGHLQEEFVQALSP